MRWNLWLEFVREVNGYAILNYSETPFLITDTEGAIESVPVFWHAVSVLG